MNSSLHTEVAYKTEEERSDPHGHIRQGRQKTGRLDVELQNVCHILREVCDHCEIAPIVSNLSKELQYFINYERRFFGRLSGENFLLQMYASDATAIQSKYQHV